PESDAVEDSIQEHPLAADDSLQPLGPGCYDDPKDDGRGNGGHHGPDRVALDKVIHAVLSRLLGERLPASGAVGHTRQSASIADHRQSAPVSSDPHQMDDAAVVAGRDAGIGNEEAGEARLRREAEIKS